MCTTIKYQILKNLKEMLFSIHHQNIRFLATEMFKVFKGKSLFKVLKGISPQIVKEIFQFRDAMP